MTQEQILTELQSGVRKHLRAYMRRNHMVSRNLAVYLGVSDSYMSDILYNKNNFQLSTLIELGLKTGFKPVLSFEPLTQPKNSITK